MCTKLFFRSEFDFVEDDALPTGEILANMHAKKHVATFICAQPAAPGSPISCARHCLAGMQHDSSCMSSSQTATMLRPVLEMHPRYILIARKVNNSTLLAACRWEEGKQVITATSRSKLVMLVLSRDQVYSLAFPARSHLTALLLAEATLIQMWSKKVDAWAGNEMIDEI